MLYLLENLLRLNIIKQKGAGGGGCFTVSVAMVFLAKLTRIFDEQN